jgi:diguanylate cyclase (GGDEF)-like protein
MHILIADDTQTDRLLLGEYIKKFGYTPIYAVNGREAVEQFKRFKPDLLILDVEMPVLSGYEAAKEIRLSFGTDQDWVPIIFLSSHIDDESIVKGIDSGGDDYLTKPVSLIVLKAKIDAMRRIVMMHNKLIDVGNQLRTANQNLLATNMMLSDLSLTDPLTGAANRRAFEECLERESRSVTRRGASLALLMIDIDNFKQYNDNNGHLLGDTCLRLVSKAIMQQLKRSSDVLARYGGEEFSVILPDTTLEGAKHLAEILRKTVEDLRVEDRGRDVQGLVTISIGAACSEPGVPFNPHALVNSADTALYEAKHQGKNRVILSQLPLDPPTDLHYNHYLDSKSG